MQAASPWDESYLPHRGFEANLVGFGAPGFTGGGYPPYPSTSISLPCTAIAHPWTGQPGWGREGGGGEGQGSPIPEGGPISYEARPCRSSSPNTQFPHHPNLALSGGARGGGAGSPMPGAASFDPLGPLGSSSSQHRRTLELILQEGSEAGSPEPIRGSGSRDSIRGSGSRDSIRGSGSLGDGPQMGSESSQNLARDPDCVSVVLGFRSQG